MDCHRYEVAIEDPKKIAFDAEVARRRELAMLGNDFRARGDLSEWTKLTKKIESKVREEWSTPHRSLATYNASMPASQTPAPGTRLTSEQIEERIVGQLGRRPTLPNESDRMAWLDAYHRRTEYDEKERALRAELQRDPADIAAEQARWAETARRQQDERPKKPTGEPVDIRRVIAAGTLNNAKDPFKRTQLQRQRAEKEAKKRRDFEEDKSTLERLREQIKTLRGSVPAELSDTTAFNPEEIKHNIQRLQQALETAEITLGEKKAQIQQLDEKIVKLTGQFAPTPEAAFATIPLAEETTKKREQELAEVEKKVKAGQTEIENLCKQITERTERDLNSLWVQPINRITLANMENILDLRQKELQKANEDIEKNKNRIQQLNAQIIALTDQSADQLEIPETLAKTLAVIEAGNRKLAEATETAKNLCDEIQKVTEQVAQLTGEEAFASLREGTSIPRAQETLATRRAELEKALLETEQKLDALLSQIKSHFAESTTESPASIETLSHDFLTFLDKEQTINNTKSSERNSHAGSKSSEYLKMILSHIEGNLAQETELSRFRLYADLIQKIKASSLLSREPDLIQRLEGAYKTKAKAYLNDFIQKTLTLPDSIQNPREFREKMTKNIGAAINEFELLTLVDKREIALEWGNIYDERLTAYLENLIQRNCTLPELSPEGNPGQFLRIACEDTFQILNEFLPPEATVEAEAEAAVDMYRKHMRDRCLLHTLTQLQTIDFSALAENEANVASVKELLTFVFDQTDPLSTEVSDTYDTIFRHFFLSLIGRRIGNPPTCAQCEAYVEEVQRFPGSKEIKQEVLKGFVENILARISHSSDEVLLEKLLENLRILDYFLTLSIFEGENNASLKEHIKSVHTKTQALRNLELNKIQKLSDDLGITMYRIDATTYLTRALVERSNTRQVSPEQLRASSAAIKHCLEAVTLSLIKERGTKGVEADSTIISTYCEAIIVGCQNLAKSKLSPNFETAHSKAYAALDDLRGEFSSETATTAINRFRGKIFKKRMRNNNAVKKVETFRILCQELTSIRDKLDQLPPDFKTKIQAQLLLAAGNIDGRTQTRENTDRIQTSSAAREAKARGEKIAPPRAPQGGVGHFASAPAGTDAAAMPPDPLPAPRGETGEATAGRAAT